MGYVTFITSEAVEIPNTSEIISEYTVKDFSIGVFAYLYFLRMSLEALYEKDDLVVSEYAGLEISNDQPLAALIAFVSSLNFLLR